MRQTWRWFGPEDKVSLSDVRQAGAEGVVTALHKIRPGDVWPREAIAERNREIESAGLTWDVAESLPVSEAIRCGSDAADGHVANWITSLENLAAEGIEVVCYNFMPVLDWTRTDLAFPRPSGARALRFDLTDLAVFDVHVLRRAGAEADYAPETIEAAAIRSRSLGQSDLERLTNTILAGLPGAAEHWTLDTFRDRISSYESIDASALRRNLSNFLKEVVPHAERLGMRLCCHPDDPPWPLFGLPRIMSTEDDFRWLVEAVPSPANGITFCTGSLGARADNDLPGMLSRLGQYVHFLHLRNVRREGDTVPGSFFEDEHLSGSTDMVAVIEAVLNEQKARKRKGRSDWCIPMRPDHGQEILDDRNRRSAPGYPAVGRLKGLAELRGVTRALERNG